MYIRNLYQRLLPDALYTCIFVLILDLPVHILLIINTINGCHNNLNYIKMNMKINILNVKYIEHQEGLYEMKK